MWGKQGWVTVLSHSYYPYFPSSANPYVLPLPFSAHPKSLHVSEALPSGTVVTQGKSSKFQGYIEEEKNTTFFTSGAKLDFKCVMD